MSNPLATDFPELAHLSREDLEDLLADPAYFQAVFHSLGRVQELYQSQAEIGMANEAIAQQNLALQDGLYSLRAETQEAFNEAKALEARWKDLERQQRDLYQRYTPAFLLMRLRHATTAQDDASETRANDFVRATPSDDDAGGLGSNGSGREVDEFVREFREVRKTYHMRAMWADRWQVGDVAWPDDQ